MIALAATLLGACGGSSAPQRGPTAARPQTSGSFRSLDVTVHVTPNIAGTSQQPRPVRLLLDVAVGAPKATEPPQVNEITLAFPPGSAYDGGHFPACPSNVIARGPQACPAGSIMGTGSVLALADTARSQGRIVVVNGGARRLYFWTELDNPVRVQAPVVGDLTDSPGGGYRLTLKVPQRLQVVAGVPIALRRLTVSAGRGTWLTSTGCPDGHWAFGGSASFGDGSHVARTSVEDCRGG